MDEYLFVPCPGLWVRVGVPLISTGVVGFGFLEPKYLQGFNKWKMGPMGYLFNNPTKIF